MFFSILDSNLQYPNRLRSKYITLNGLRTPSGNYGDEILTISDNKNKSVHGVTNVNRFTFHNDNSFENEVKYFFDCIKKNKEVEIGNIHDAERIMKTIDLIYKGAKWN